MTWSEYWYEFAVETDKGKVFIYISLEEKDRNDHDFYCWNSLTDRAPEMEILSNESQSNRFTYQGNLSNKFPTK